MVKTTVEQRRRDRVLRTLFACVDEERWFSRQDFNATVAELWGDARTINKYWSNLRTAGVIELSAMRGRNEFGRLSEDIYNKLEMNGTILEVEASVKITGRGRGRPKLVEVEELL
jgi:hypothetical protein